MFSPPLNSNVPTFGTGLQIGLSAVSPGFAIMPKERRRKLSGLGFSDVVEDLRARDRRSVSENDIRGSLCPDPDFAGPEPSLNSHGDVELPESSRSGRKHWKWLKGLFVRSQ